MRQFTLLQSYEILYDKNLKGCVYKRLQISDKIVWSQRKSSSKESIDNSHQLTAISGNYTSFILMFDKSTDLSLTEPNFNYSVWSQQELNILHLSWPLGLYSNIESLTHDFWM